MLRRLAAQAACAAPRLSLAAAARLADPDKTGPTREELATLFPELPDARIEPVRQEIAAQERRNELLFRLVQERSMLALDPLVALRDAGGLATVRSEPTILALWHAGVPLVEISAIARLGVPVVVAKPSNPCPPIENLRFYDIHGSQAGRLQLLKRGLELLKEGRGAVLFFLDRPVGDATAEVEFLGCPLRLGRGAASLARMSGARLVPVTSHWAEGSSHRVEMSFHPPLPAPDVPTKPRDVYEDAVLAGAARWFEGYLREHPERTRVIFARKWLAGPKPGDAGPLD